jgi:hypothetical protein
MIKDVFCSTFYFYLHVFKDPFVFVIYNTWFVQQIHNMLHSLISIQHKKSGNTKFTVSIIWRSNFSILNDPQPSRWQIATGMKFERQCCNWEWEIMQVHRIFKKLNLKWNVTIHYVQKFSSWSREFWRHVEMWYDTNISEGLFPASGWYEANGIVPIPPYGVTTCRTSWIFNAVKTTNLSLQTCPENHEYQ